MHKKSFKSFSSLMGSVSLVLGLCLSSGQAHAGFQWVPSADAGSVNTYQNQMATAPVPRSAPVPSVQRMASPAASAFESMPMVQISSDEAPAHSNRAPMQTLVPSAGAEPVMDSLSSEPRMDDKPVKGFANNVPLSVALRQVLPQEYGYSVASDVNLSSIVSWKGGDSWRGTLTRLLSSSGLSMQEKGQVIHIVRSKDSGASMADATKTSIIRPVSRMGAAPSLQDLKAGGKPMTLGTLSAQDAGEPEFAAPLTSGAASAMRALPSARDEATSGGAMVVNSWRANRTETLRVALERWGKASGVEVVWQSEYDYPLQASVSLSGTFEEAVRGLLTGFQDAKPQPTAILHAGQSGGAAILVVGVRGNNYSD